MIIEAAPTDAIKEALETDLAGNSRIQKNAIDLGAYEALPYSVTYEKNGATAGDVPTDKRTYKQGNYVTIQGNSGNLAKTGSTFVGWNIAADGTGTFYAENTPFLMGTTNVTFYAVCTKNPTYTVAYDGNGATGGHVPQDHTSHEANQMVTVQGNSGNLIKTGATFAGWNTRIDGTSTSYQANDTFQITDSITLYAQWLVSPPPSTSNPSPAPISEDNDYSPTAEVKIILYSNGGTTLEPMEIHFNTKVSDLPTPTRAGYHFDGWYEDEALTKKWLEETIVRENMELYVKWTALPVEEPERLQEPQPQLPKPVVMFGDIERHWAKEMIEELTALGIIQGYEDGTFHPDAPISRMHVAVLLTRAFSLEVGRATADFSDVPPTHPYYAAITALQQAGIVDGTNGAFLPAENITRAQVAKVLVGILGVTPEGTSSFADVYRTHWSAGYIAVLERKGIALGDNGHFYPNESVTRAQFVAFLYRIMQIKE